MLEERYRVVRYDTRGNGAFPVLAGPYCIDDHADDSLLDQLGIGRADLVGLSLGAITARGSGPATPSGSTGSPCSAPALSGRPASAWTDRAATVRAGGSAAIAKAVVERWFTSEFLAAHPDVRAAHEAMVAAISAFAEPEPSMGDVPALGSTPTAHSSNPGWLPAPLTAHWPAVSHIRPRNFRPAPTH